MNHGKIEISTDTLMDLILFDDIETANEKLAPLYLTAVEVEGVPGTVDILTVFGSYVCTIGPESRNKVYSNPQALDEAGQVMTSAQEDSDRETTVAIPPVEVPPPFGRTGKTSKSQYRGAVKDGETDHDAVELEARFHALLMDPKSTLAKLLAFYARGVSWNEGQTTPTVNTTKSTSDERVVNNTVRHAYRVLNEDEKAAMQRIKDLGLELIEAIEAIGKGREYSLAITKTEEAVMWAVKGLTK